MSEIEILGGKLVGDLFCHYSMMVDIGKDRHDVIPKIKSERPIHDDLRAAIQALAIHLPVILEDVAPGEISDINSGVNGFDGTDRVRELMERFTITEFMIDKEVGGVSLKGTKVLALGVLTIETPVIKFDGEYHYRLELRYGVDKAVKEIELYREGKQAPEPIQTELFPTGEPDDQEENGDGTAKEKPKRGRKKKVKKVVMGIYGDSRFPDYMNRDIITEDTAEDGDIIGIDENDGAPILKNRPPVSEPASNFHNPEAIPQ